MVATAIVSLTLLAAALAMRFFYEHKVPLATLALSVTSLLAGAAFYIASLHDKLSHHTTHLAVLENKITPEEMEAAGHGWALLISPWAFFAPFLLGLALLLTALVMYLLRSG
ncbi:hypothetical protein CYG49_04230, partial [Candidatus Saccharibacteria bacterium]